MLVKIEPEQMSREDWTTCRLLMKAHRRRKELAALEAELAQSIAAFGRRRGYLFNAYREEHMINDFKRLGYLQFLGDNTP